MAPTVAMGLQVAAHSVASALAAHGGARPVVAMVEVREV